MVIKEAPNFVIIYVMKDLNFIAFLAHVDEMKTTQTMIEGQSYFYPNMVGDSIIREFEMSLFKLEVIEADDLK